MSTGFTPPIQRTARRRVDLAADLLVTASDPEWDLARQPWNLAVDQQPAAVGVPGDAADVVALVRYAHQHELRIAVQTTGHSAMALGSLSNTLLLRTARMREVTIDAENRTCRAEAGALWMDVTAPAAEQGLAALAGSAPDIGVAGYTLGGGLGWLGRRFGLAANSVRRAQVVTAAGQLIEVDGDHEPYLFWALRGGGGGYAIVTALEFELYPVGELYAGALMWPLERATEVLGTWTEWLRQIPDELTSVGRLLRIPPLPDVPPPLRGREFVVIEAAYLGERQDGERLLAPLRALSAELDTFAMVSPPALEQLHMVPPAPVAAIGDGMLLSALPAAAVQELGEVAGAGSGSRLLCADIRHLGGALARAKFGGGVVSSLDAEFGLNAVGLAPDAQAAQDAERDIDAIQQALGRWRAGRAFLNLAERPRDGDELFGVDGHRRLRLVKSIYDPHDFIQAAQPVRPVEP